MPNNSSTRGAMETLQAMLKPERRDQRSALYRDIIMNAMKCQDLDVLDLKIINRAVAEFQHAACVFKPYRSVRKVSIFGSARVDEKSPYFKMAVEFGRATVRNGFMVITGAGEGIMRAGIEGARPEQSFGVNILLPSEQAPTGLIKDEPKLVTFRYFFTRKIFFVMEADAIALFPGGFGTQDEGFEVLTLLQTGKTSPMPVVLMELPGERYWEAWDSFVRQQMLDRGFINPEDLSFYRIIRSPEEAASWIKSCYSTYHSMRQVGNKLVLRLEKELQNSHLELLNRKFNDLVASGRIQKTAALKEEADEPGLSSKPRISFINSRKSAGRLNELILAINELGKSV